MKHLLLLALLAGCATQAPEKEVIPPTKEVVFTTELEHEWIVEMIKAANCVVNLPELRSDLEAIESFDYTEDDGRAVASKLGLQKANVRLYTAHWAAPWKNRVTAINYPGQNEVLFNTRTNPRPLSDLMETLYHEYGHVLDYHHGDNGLHTTGVPAELGLLGKKHLSKCID